MLQLKSFVNNPYKENTYIIYCGKTKECAVVDPGCCQRSEQNAIVEYIEEKKLNPIILLNTHCHIDHVLGNKFIFDKYGLKPNYHEYEKVIIEAIPSYAPSMGINYEISPTPEAYLQNNKTIKIGEQELKCLLTPGHSPGSISFYCKESGIVIGGDVLFYESIGRTDLPGGNRDQLIESVKTVLFPLGDEIKVYPGHGKLTGIGYEKKYNPFLNKL